jgi:hypothetical protein
MADETHTIRSINWREVFPFTHLFKAFRVAIHPSKLVLALTALLLIYSGGRILDAVWMDKHLVQPGDLLYHANSDEMLRTSFQDGMLATPRLPRGIFISFFNFEVAQVNRVVQGVLNCDLGTIHSGVIKFIFAGPSLVLYGHWLFFTLFAIWFLFIWSIFGGAISRIAAVHVARDEKISVRQALRFSTNKLLSFGFAPLIPILILLVIGAIVAIGGLLLYIPVIGPIALSVLFFLALIAGLVMALVLLGLVGGFNLMYPTIAVEGSDSFDAISRSFSYVFARPWRMLWYTLVAIVYGALTYTFVRFFIYLVLMLTHHFIGWWLRGQPATYWNGLGGEAAIWPAPDMWNLPYNVHYEGLKWSEDIAAGIISFWIYLVIGLLGAYAISFYFSANTIIYYLMRREVDATEMEDVSVDEAEDEFGDGAPMAASESTPLTATAIPAPASPATSAPGGGVTGTAGSADPGGGTASQPYTAPATDAPTDSGPTSTEDRPPA